MLVRKIFRVSSLYLTLILFLGSFSAITSAATINYSFEATGLQSTDRTLIETFTGQTATSVDGVWMVDNIRFTGVFDYDNAAAISFAGSDVTVYELPPLLEFNVFIDDEETGFIESTRKSSAVSNDSLSTDELDTVNINSGYLNHSFDLGENYELRAALLVWNGEDFLETTDQPGYLPPEGYDNAFASFVVLSSGVENSGLVEIKTTDLSISEVPLPAAAWLFFAALSGLFAVRRVGV